MPFRLHLVATLITVAVCVWTKAVRLLEEDLSPQAGQVAPSSLLLPRRKFANVLLAGAQKAGTSALYAYLKDNPLVCHPKARPDLQYTEKESHFFDRYFSEGSRYYEGLYEDCPENATVLLDATPDYLVWPERIADFSSDFKVILILREPVSREISYYNHILRESPLNSEYKEMVYDSITGKRKSFEQYMREHTIPEIEKRTNYGLYVDHVSKWMKLFDKVFILNYDELKHRPQAALARINAYLGLSSDSSRLSIPRKNFRKVRDRDPIPCRVQDELFAYFEKSNNDLYDLFKKKQVQFEPFSYSCQPK